MARKPFVIDVGPFSEGGLNTQLAPHLIKPSQAQVSRGVDYNDGDLHGVYIPGTAVSGSPFAPGYVPKAFNYRDGAASPWRLSQYVQFACLDGCYNAGGSTFYGISYYTNNTTTSAVPQFAAGPNVTDKTLGVSPPTATVTTNGTGNPRAYRVTSVIKYTDSGLTMESNPSAIITTTGSNGAVITFGAAVPADTTGIEHHNYIYASQDGNTTGPFYFVHTTNAGDTDYLDAPYPVPTPDPILLNWKAGGSPQGALYKYDHSTPPSVFVLANTLMGAAATAQTSLNNAARGGILLAAAGATLYWSMSGNPWYFPLLNAEALDDVVEAIVVHEFAAYVITRSSVYLVTGSDDTDLSITRTQATHGCNPGGGQAACITPYGIIYPSPLGIAMLDLTGSVNTNSHIITKDVIAYGFTKALPGGVAFGGFQDDFYIFNGGAQTDSYMIDLAAWPTIRVTMFLSNGYAPAFAQIHAFGASLDRGLYAAVPDLSGNASIKPWWPRLGNQLSTPSTRYVWTHQTGNLAAGDLAKKKRFTRFWMEAGTNAGSFPITLNFDCYNFDGSLAGQINGLTGSGWLPSTFTGSYLQIFIQASDATNTLDMLRIEGESYE